MANKVKRWISSLMVLMMCLYVLPVSAFAATSDTGTLTELGTGSYSITLKNSFDSAVNYEITAGEATNTVTLSANESFTLKGDKGESYSIKWLGAEGLDQQPAQTTKTGTFGQEASLYDGFDGYDGQAYAAADVSNADLYCKTFNHYESVDFYYVSSSVIPFYTDKSVISFIYVREDTQEEYKGSWTGGREDARNKALNAVGVNPSDTDRYTNVTTDGVNEGYMWVHWKATPYIAFEPEITSTVTGDFTVAALNVDGMPQNVKIAKVYDLKLNEDGPGSEGSKAIGQYIENSGIDILALSENFNFSEEIKDNAPSYKMATQRASIPTEVGITELNNSLFPFDTDGLNLMSKNNIQVSGESWTAWNEHYSPTTNYVVVDVPDKNGADGMIDKGYRFYQVKVAAGVVVDVYILHMDADSTTKDIEARTSQLKQLAQAINTNENGNPIIVMGDTNCRYTRDTIKTDLVDATGLKDAWTELVHEGTYPTYGTDAWLASDKGGSYDYPEAEVVDKILYLNPQDSNLKIEAVKYDIDNDGYKNQDSAMGDHWPVIVTFKYTYTPDTVEHEHKWSDTWSKDAGYHWHDCLNENCDVAANSDKDGYAAHKFDEKVTEEPTCTETGVKTLTCSVCGYNKTDVIPNTGHKYDDGEITKQPTVTEEGEKTYTCTVCEHTYIESIPKLDVEYEVKAVFDKEHYNVGDTATAKIMVSSDIEGANFAALGFKLNIPEGLTLKEITTPLEGGTVSQSQGNFAYNVNSKNPITVTSEGVCVAEATFTVNSIADESKTATLGFNSAEVTESDEIKGAVSQTVSDETTIHNIKVTLKSGDNATINGTTEDLVLYAKYNESGLYSNENRTTTATEPKLTANEGYRLADMQWSDNMADFDAIVKQTFTQSEEYTAQTVKTFVVTFVAGDNVTFKDGANTSVTVDSGTEFKNVVKPEYTLTENYTFDGWFNGSYKLTDDSVINSDITVTAKASAKQFNFTQSADDNAQITDLTGVTDNTVTYGQDITFKATANSGYVISSVSYTVGNSAGIPLTANENGVYTINGAAITGDINVEVVVTKYYTVTFTAGTGTSLETKTAYVKSGEAALYTDTTFTDKFVVPQPVANDGYRLAADNAEEPLWSDSTNKHQSSALGQSVTFTADTTLTAQAVKVWTVTLEAGQGSFAPDTTTVFTIDDGKTLTDIPTPIAPTGYKFDGWDKETTAPITADTTFTAQYVNATYTLTLPSVNGVTFAVEGATLENGVYTVTYGTDVKITMTTDDSVKVTKLSYTIGEGQPVDVQDMSGFTINGTDIIGNIAVNITSNNVYQITVTVEGGNGTVNGETSATISFDENTRAEDVASKFTFTPDAGYKVVAPQFETVTGDKTYTVTFTHETYSVTGIEDIDSATHGTDLTFTPSVEGKIVTGVSYKVGEGEFTELTANADGTYTIKGDAIVGDIEIKLETIDGNFEFIAATDYVAAPAGKKVVIFNTSKLTTGTYTLDTYGDMFWSSKYNGYVAFVANDEDNQTITDKITVSQNTVTEIAYSGDINGDEQISPADSAPMNAVLHDIDVDYEISDKMRFEFDVTGDGTVSSLDMKWILDQYTKIKALAK